MAIRTALLNGNNITRDTDFSKYIESVSEPGVIEGLEVSATKVGIGKAFVPCLRTNGETIYALVYNFSEVTISGNGDVFIEVSQTYIDDGELANEDGTGIATIQVGTMPSKNALKLATISNGVVTDERNIIPKVGELNTQIVSIFDELADLDGRVEKLEEAGAIDHLEESGLVGELYTLEDKLFKQYTPNIDDSTLDANIGDVDANTQIHIQRIGTGVASNQLKLKLKMVGASTQDLVVEVRKGVQVTVTPNSEAYWYGDEVVASGSIPYSSISSDYSEITVNLDNAFGGNKGELLDVVLYMATVNASNYYCVACDSTQYSEAFSYVSVNGSTRSRSKLMPYCISDGFAQSLLVKVNNTDIETQAEWNISTNITVPIVANQYDYNNYVKDNGLYVKIADIEGGFFGSGTITVNITGYGSASAPSSQAWKDIHHFYYQKNNGDIIEESDTIKYISDTNATLTIPVVKGDTIISVYVRNGDDNFNNSFGLASLSTTPPSPGQAILSKKGDIFGNATKLNSIGQPGFIAFFGSFGGKFVNGISDIQECIDLIKNPTTTTEATAGSIAPSNFVGYIVIGDFKIPYYK